MPRISRSVTASALFACYVVAIFWLLCMLLYTFLQEVRVCTVFVSGLLNVKQLVKRGVSKICMTRRTGKITMLRAS